MSFRILVDLTHSEQLEEFPDFELIEETYEVEYLEEGSLEFEIMEDYDVLFIGGILQSEKGQKDKFTREELRDIKRFVGEGGSLFVTAGAGGDLDIPMKDGSIRVLYKMTGVRRAWNGVVQEASGNFLVSKENLILHDIFSHPITKGLNELVFPNCTFFSISEDEDVDDIIVSSDKADFRYAANNEVSKIGQVPICVVSKFYNGRSLFVGSTDFLREDSDFGIDAGDNLKFLQNALEWLTFET